MTEIRYAMCWEDADVLLAALNPGPGGRLVSVVSGGDNTLSLLTTEPSRVIALDVSRAQLFCLEMRVAAYAALDHPGLLEFLGSRPSARRPELYAAVRRELSPAARDFWDARRSAIAAGVGGAGKFEGYLALFRRVILPLTHSAADVEDLLRPRALAHRLEFYEQHWNNRRWRLLLSLFLSRAVLGALGRGPAAFEHVEGTVADRILERVRYGFAVVDPTTNPYLHWILRGRHGHDLPHALRAENFEAIRRNLDRLELRQQSVQDFAAAAEPGSVAGFNLSDVFEYLSAAESERALADLATAGRPGARLAYWNMLVPRARPASLEGRLLPLGALATDLARRDKAFFYSRFVVEEVR